MTIMVKIGIIVAGEPPFYLANPATNLCDQMSVLSVRYHEWREKETEPTTKEFCCHTDGVRTGLVEGKYYNYRET